MNEIMNNISAEERYCFVVITTEMIYLNYRK